MSKPIAVLMPLNMTSEMMRAVRDHPFTKCETLEEWYAKLGWLICAYDVLIDHRIPPHMAEGVTE